MFAIVWRFSGGWIILLAAAAAGMTPYPRVPQTGLAPYIGYNESSERIADSYIIKFKEGYTLQNHLDWIGLNFSSMGHEYHDLDILPGYHLQSNQSVIDNIVRRDAGVEWIEPSSRMYLPEHRTTADIEVERNSSVRRRTKRWQAIVQQNAPFQLAMQSSAERLSLGADGVPSFWHWREAGRDVDVYIFDCGINITHPEFGVRASNFQEMDISPYYSGSDRIMTDTASNKHGTCIASLAGGRLNGAAKRANLINVKVCGMLSAESPGVIRALGDVRKEHNAKRRRSRRIPFAGSVINMSFGGSGYSLAMAIAIRKVYQAGIPVVVSAGNNNTFTSGRYPCNLRETICVAAVDNEYRKANFSNFGPEVEVAAPGERVMCASFQDDMFGSTFHSGTSQAAAYVSGTLAHFISYEKLRSNAALIRKRMRDNSISGILDGFPRTTPNRLINNGIQKPNKSPIQPYVGAPKSQR
ncbi:MAG: hypothetical protein Q9165_000223 [Trypethelium subeluteriae]